MLSQVIKLILFALVSLSIMTSHTSGENTPYPNSSAVIASTEDCNKQITHLALSPDGLLLATSDDITAPVQLWNTDTFSLIKTIPISGDHVTDITFSPDNQLLAWASSIGDIYNPYVEGSVEIYDLKSNKITALLKNVAEIVTELNVFDDDTTIAFLGSRYGYLRANIQIWDINSQTNITKREAWDIAPAFSSHSLTSFLGTQLSLGITNEFSYQIEQWDGQNDIVLRQADVQYPISVLAVNLDGSLLALADAYGEISLWDTRTLTITLDFESGDASVAYLTFIGDDQLLSVGQDENQQNIRIWDIDLQPKIIAQKSFTEDTVGRFAVEPDQQTLILATGDDAPFGISLWDYQSDVLKIVEFAC